MAAAAGEEFVFGERAGAECNTMMEVVVIVMAACLYVPVCVVCVRWRRRRALERRKVADGIGMFVDILIARASFLWCSG